MSSKDCGNHGHRRRKICRRICVGILIFNFILLVMVLIVWAILEPRKPTFILQDATVYAFNVSTPNLLTSTFQVTLYSRNQNDKIGIYYDKLDVYATYRNQQITLPTVIRPTYQGHKDINIWSPYIYGVGIPVAPYNSVLLQQDQANGAVLLIIKVDGRVRWKVGTVITGRYHLYVTCQAYINFGARANGIVVENNGIKYQLVTRCSVSV